jgi:hypothetical protein
MKQATIDNLRWLAAGAVALVVFAAVGLAAVGQEPANVAGDWMLEVTTDGGGTTTPSVMLEQDGTTLSGHYSSEALGEADVTGTVTGSDFTFSLEADLQGQAIDVTYTGTLQEDGTLSGEIDLGAFGGGPFTGKRR